jgi:hypothetical protein
MEKPKPGSVVVINGKEFVVSGPERGRMFVEVGAALAGGLAQFVPMRSVHYGDSKTGRPDGFTAGEIRANIGRKLAADQKRARKARQRQAAAAAGGFESRAPRGMLQS